MELTELYSLKVIKNEKDYKMALKSMESVFDEDTGPLAEYAETLAILIEHYEEERFPVKRAQDVEVLKFLMEQNGLKQKDLVGILGGKSTVSEIFNRKRPLNLQHIRILADKFHVKPATFL
ncbi:MAG: transcriptional regulator [Deltaproteobacteria bacterium]|nr:transcriptional regulator [Deltaproteobacteria bacterium]